MFKDSETPIKLATLLPMTISRLLENNT